MKTLVNVTTADDFAAAQTVEAERFVRLVITVTGKTVRMQLGHGYPPNYDTPEIFLSPAVYALERDCSGVRVKSGAKGNPAQVSIEAAEPWDVPGG